MDLENIMLSEISILYDIIYMWNLKNNTNKCMQNRNRLTDIENKPMIIKGKREREGTK